MHGLAVMAWFAALALGVGAPESPYRQGAVVRGDGGWMAYFERAGTGPALILIPGSWDDHTAYDAFLNGVNSELHIVIVELPGHGASMPAAVQPTMRSFGEDVFRVADELKLDTFYVGGHSIGGMIAIEMAGQTPERLLGVISIEGWTHHSVVKDAFDGALANTLTPEQERQRVANRERTQAQVTKAQIDAFGGVWRQWDGFAILSTTTVPVLEIWGDRGRDAASRAAMKIPERETITIAWIRGASHWLLLEQPLEVARAVNAFIPMKPSE
ncbi:MAG: hypothetical protein AMXMBFR84_05140 [Candidatus Hydrogenedentota bacterium]